MIKNANIIDDVKDDVNYAWYVTKHKANIVPPMLEMGLPLSQALKHDLSKYGPKEFGPYRDWFVGPKGLKGTQDPGIHARWRKAVEHHYFSPNNLHHWSKIDPTHPENFPINNRMESVADWYSVNKTNRTTENFPTFKRWFKKREDKLPLDIFTKKEIERRIGLTKAASIMEKIGKSPRLLGMGVGALAGGVLGSNVKDKQGNSAVGTIGGAVTGGILGGLAGNNWAKLAPAATKKDPSLLTRGAAAVKGMGQAASQGAKMTAKEVGTGVQKMVNPVVATGQNLVQGAKMSLQGGGAAKAAKPTAEHTGLLNFFRSKVRENAAAVDKSTRQTPLLQNPTTKNPKRIGGNMKTIPAKGSALETERPASKGRGSPTSFLGSPMVNTIRANALAKRGFTV